MSHSPKAESLAALKQDALLLERWQRQGEPLRYSRVITRDNVCGWPCSRLSIPDTATRPEPKPVPKIVRLDSMSLFDSGKSVLKDGSTKILVNALVGIKARPAG